MGIFDWRKFFTDILLSLIKYINQTGTLKNLDKKDYWWHKEIKIPTWVVGVFIYFTFVLVFIYEFGISFKTFIFFNFFVCVFMYFSIYFLQKYKKDILKCDDSVSLIGMVLIIFLFLIVIIRNLGLNNFLLTPLPACVMILNIFLGPLVSIIVLIVLTIIMTMFYNYNFAVFFIMFFLGLYSIYGTRNVLNRKEITKTGINIGILNLFIVLMAKGFSLVKTENIFDFVIFGLINGVGSAVITIGVLPYMESFFSIATNIKLLEISDFMQPILKKMLMEAPGTYNHSIVVGNLAENAAREIGANPLLTRAGAYYHDIGKISKALYFIENKPRFIANKHDDLSPNMSVLVIISHVKDGIQIAKKIKLPKQVIDIIEEHHGNSLIAFFYDKAIKMYGAENVDQKMYRYPYKKPKSKESVLIMIADSVEATMHSEKEFSHTNLQNVVNKIINTKFIDGQFEESNITLSDLKIISESFVKTLAGIYHTRIKYPDLKN